MVTPEQSLYVGDLAQDVTESDLYAKFSPAGRIQSVRICRHKETKKSLGYGYVNFQDVADADKAMTLFNFDPLHSRPMRLMWAQHDPYLRKTGKSNIFVKNLNHSISSKELYHIFVVLGKILSCKVATDENGSKGYGFVHYENEQSALDAIKKFNGTEINGQKILVTKFVPRKDRMHSSNVFVKNFGTYLDDEGLKKLFGHLGEILNAKIMKDDNNISKGFGFVCFRDASAAKRAIHEMDGCIFNRKKLYVSYAQTTVERQQALARERNPPTTEDGQSDAKLVSKYRKNNIASNNENANLKPKEINVESDAYRTRNPDYLGKQLTESTSPVSNRQQSPGNGRSSSSCAKPFSSTLPTDLKHLLHEQVMQITTENNAKKITGMLLELDTSDILYLLDSAPVLREKVQEAEQILYQHQAKQQVQPSPLLSVDRRNCFRSRNK